MALDVVRAESVRQAAGMLAASEGARFLGGGTLLVRATNAGDPDIDRLVLSDGLGLDGIEVTGGNVSLGGAVTMAAVARHPRLGFLRPVAESIGGPAVRAMATVAGNIFAPYPYGDFTVALLALDAALVTEDADRTETVDLADYLARPPAILPRIVRSIEFAIPADGAFRFAKAIRRRPHGAAVLSIAAVLPMAGRKVNGARIAYGAMAERPMRAPTVEAALEGRPLDEETIGRAVAIATEGCAPRTDALASDWYRMTVLPVYLKRLLSGE